MAAKIKYTDEPIKARVIQDFLPPPEELAFREEGIKVTIALSKKSVEFFKSEAIKHHTQYQRMIRRLIDAGLRGCLRQTSCLALNPELQQAAGQIIFHFGKFLVESFRPSRYHTTGFRCAHRG